MLVSDCYRGNLSLGREGRLQGKPRPESHGAMRRGSGRNALTKTNCLTNKTGACFGLILFNDSKLILSKFDIEIHFLMVLLEVNRLQYSGRSLNSWLPNFDFVRYRFKKKKKLSEKLFSWQQWGECCQSQCGRTKGDLQIYRLCVVLVK